MFVKGALLWTGDSHAAQGNGEINLTALETAYKEMNVTVDVLKNMKLEWPRIETKDSWITLGIDRDLNKALDILKEETTTFLMEQRKLTKDEAAKLMMAAWDCRVTQVVDVNKGLHCFSAKSAKERRKIEALPEKENKSYLVTVGKDADLNKAMDDAAWAMIDLLQQDKKLSRLDAYSLASMVMDCRLAAPTGAAESRALSGAQEHLGGVALAMEPDFIRKAWRQVSARGEPALGQPILIALAALRNPPLRGRHTRRGDDDRSRRTRRGGRRRPGHRRIDRAARRRSGSVRAASGRHRQGAARGPAGAGRAWLRLLAGRAGEPERQSASCAAARPISTPPPASRCSKYAARASSTKAATRTASPTRTTGSIPRTPSSSPRASPKPSARFAPEQKAGILANREGFLAELKTRQTRWTRPAPFAGTRLIAYHNSWPYFARRFRLDVIAFIEPKPGVAPSPAHLAQLISEGRKAQVRAILHEPYEPEDASRFVAQKLGVPGGALRHSRSAAAGGNDDYVALFEYNVAALAAHWVRGPLARMSGRRFGGARLLVLPFAASVAFVLIHAYLGVHVLRRKIVFADLALAQLSALGATVAFAVGHPRQRRGLRYALLFTAIGAALLTLTRGLARFVSQEAFVGIVYVVADRGDDIGGRSLAAGSGARQEDPGGQHPDGRTHRRCELRRVVRCDRRLALACAAAAARASRSRAAPGRAGPRRLGLGSVFFLSFGVVVTSSVTTAGVLLVFSFLIVPAVIGSIFSGKLPVVLLIAWGVGIAACAAGLAGSYALDLPTGAAMVMALAGFLVLAGLAKVLIFADRASGGLGARAGTIAAAGLAVSLLAVLSSCVWLMVNPTGDQPLLALVERATGIGPAQFLNGPSARRLMRPLLATAAAFRGKWTGSMRWKKRRAIRARRCPTTKSGASRPISRASTR